MGEAGPADLVGVHLAAASPQQGASVTVARLPGQGRQSLLARQT